ncbi:MAG: hypothetical protein AAFR81_22015 [Chloroflexota bacterium]
MKHWRGRLLLIIATLYIMVVAVEAQNTLTIGTQSGVLIDYPENWTVEQDSEADTRLFLNDGQEMFGFVNIIPAEALRGDTPDEVLDDLRDDIEDRDGDEIGFFNDIEEYTVDEEWTFARISRIRSDDRLIEMLLVAEVRELSIYVRANFRIGSQDFYYPIFDEFVASARNRTDDIPITTGSFAQTPLSAGEIGTITDPLNLSVLNTTYITREERYQFDYPAVWDVQRVGELRYTLFHDTDTVTVFSNFAIFEAGELTNAERVQAVFPETVMETETFMLNDLPAERIVFANEVDNVRRIVMSTTRGTVQSVLDVRVNLDAPTTIDATLRAILYSVRTTETPFTLSAVGNAARLGLTSAGIYGEPPAMGIADVEDDPFALTERFVTLNGFFTFSYPEAWYLDFSQGDIVLTTEEEYALFDPDRGEAQVIINFIDQINEQTFDDASPIELINFVIETDFFSEDWSEVTEFESAGRRATFADFSFFSTDILSRTFFVELDDTEDVLVRLDLIVDEDDLETYMPVAEAILETARFED